MKNVFRKQYATVEALFPAPGRVLDYEYDDSGRLLEQLDAGAAYEVQA